MAQSSADPWRPPPDIADEPERTPTGKSTEPPIPPWVLGQPIIARGLPGQPAQLSPQELPEMILPAMVVGTGEDNIIFPPELQMSVPFPPAKPPSNTVTWKPAEPPRRELPATGTAEQAMVSGAGENGRARRLSTDMGEDREALGSCTSASFAQGSCTSALFAPGQRDTSTRSSMRQSLVSSLT